MMIAHLAGHAVHLLLVVVAALVFVVFVVRDVRAHGRPSFSWRLRPRDRPQK